MNLRILLLCLPAGLWAALANPSAGQPDGERQVLTVSATGVERIPATVADIRMGIEERASTDEEARERMAARSSQLLEFLRAEGVERLETQGLRLHPIYDYTRGDREVVGYQAVTVVRFRTEAGTAGFLVDEAIGQGANQIQDLVFTAPEDQVEEARQQALRKATRVALERAEAVLGELGLEWQTILRIRIEPTDDEPPVVPMRSVDSRSGSRDRGSEMEGEEPEVRATVTLELSY